MIEKARMLTPVREGIEWEFVAPPVLAGRALAYVYSLSSLTKAKRGAGEGNRTLVVSLEVGSGLFFNQ